MDSSKRLVGPGVPWITRSPGEVLGLIDFAERWVRDERPEHVEPYVEAVAIVLGEPARA